jgi:S1-C subfamily serine protease
MFLHEVKLGLMIRLACSAAVSGRIFAVILTLVAFGCAAEPRDALRASDADSPIPGCIGAAVRAEGAHVVVSALGPAATAAGLRLGDVVISYNGKKIADVREFERLVLDSPPGSAATVEVLRQGQPLVIDVPVNEIPTEDLA